MIILKSLMMVHQIHSNRILRIGNKHSLVILLFRIKKMEALMEMFYQDSGLHSTLRLPILVKQN